MMVFSNKLLLRYQELKQQEPECVLLMQVGAFMQVMNEDAQTLSKISGLKLKMVGDVDKPVIVGGFFVSGLDLYVGKLTRSGNSVAIAMQDENKERQIIEIVKIHR